MEVSEGAKKNKSTKKNLADNFLDGVLGQIWEYKVSISTGAVLIEALTGLKAIWGLCWAHVGSFGGTMG